MLGSITEFVMRQIVAKAAQRLRSDFIDKPNIGIGGHELVQVQHISCESSLPFTLRGLGQKILDGGFEWCAIEIFTIFNFEPCRSGCYARLNFARRLHGFVEGGAVDAMPLLVGFTIWLPTHHKMQEKGPR